MQFTFMSNNANAGISGRITVEGVDEFHARRAAMAIAWGDVADGVVPHAPHYEGKGLLLVDVVA